MANLPKFCKMARTFWIGVIPVFAVALFATTAQADPLIVGNNFIGSGPIQTYDFNGGALKNFFVPAGASGSSGLGVAVLGNKIYYTEGSGGFASLATDFIRVAPFNGGAGGADITTLPNPRPGTAVQDLAVANGVLYALTGYPGSPPLQVFALNPVTGVVSGPVNIAGPANEQSNGFTVLPNGNFLINNGDGKCTYNQYDPTSGMLVSGSTPIVISAGGCFGVTTNGTALYFFTVDSSLTIGSFTKTDLSGGGPVTQSVTGNRLFDISLVTFGASGVPGKHNCKGKTVCDLAHQYGGGHNQRDDNDECEDEDGGIHKAALALGYASNAALKNAIKRFCASP